MLRIHFPRNRQTLVLLYEFLYGGYNSLSAPVILIRLGFHNYIPKIVHTYSGAVSVNTKQANKIAGAVHSN